MMWQYYMYNVRASGSVYIVSAIKRVSGRGRSQGLKDPDKRGFSVNTVLGMR